MKLKLFLTSLIIASLGIFLVLNGVVTEEFDLGALLFWGVLAIVSETFLVILPSGASQSVGMAVYIAALITSGPVIAMILPILSFVFRVQKIDGKRLYVFNCTLSNVVFNMATHVFYIGVTGYFYYKYIGFNSSISMVIIGALMALTVIELMSIMMISIFFLLRDGNSEIPLIKSFISALPSTWAVGALGLFLAFAEMNYAKAIVGLFFIPLLLARYSFKLYFDSQKIGMETIEALNEALFVRDEYTAGHTKRVEEYAVMLAEGLNYSTSQRELIKSAARLHDIGKIGIPDSILNKAGKLTDVEYERIKDHAAMGAQILGNVDTLKKIAEIVRHHHERPDGRGYPDGLTDDKIPRDSAILAIADTYDAMTSDRPYREALSKEYAVEELIKYKGSQFNAYLVEVFVTHIDEHEAAKLINEVEAIDVFESTQNDEEVPNKAAEVSA